MTWKQLVKAPLRPIVGPILRRLEARTENRLSEIAAVQTQMRAELDGLQLALPAILASFREDPPAREYRRAVDELAQRVEFVRKEILFELRYSNREVEVESLRLPEARILSPEKVRQMGAQVRLNLGAGHVGRPGYLNVDARELDGIDVVADIRHLPFEKGSLAEIYSAHMLEHFPLEELRSVLLPYWVSLLRDGGQFVAVVPDMETMITEYVAGRFDFEELREVTYGTQEYEGDFHYNGFSPASLRALLEGAGLSDVTVRASARRNGMCYEMELAGVRPSASLPG